VWLDRGELEKLIAMGQQPEALGGQLFAAPRPVDQGVRTSEGDYRGSGHGDHDHTHGHDREHDHDRQRYASREHHQHYGPPQNRKRSSWLGELFGGDD
jgi:Zn-finger nucleic acid-binding protein